ncbi:hypothetical protein Pcinc_001381 [Petrolisthes cinctipes]|uniref:Uncharacterized protein n=1 Tax=Petrolisthes cinctipes TaxID=88211 RepID=A0AAE1GLE8_PETCI|nr:hypothetical protein Pcinc_001381 [Petrolisthes cinctipes]
MKVEKIHVVSQVVGPAPPICCCSCEESGVGVEGFSWWPQDYRGSDNRGQHLSLHIFCSTTTGLVALHVGCHGYRPLRILLISKPIFTDTNFKKACGSAWIVGEPDKNVEKMLSEHIMLFWMIIAVVVVAVTRTSADHINKYGRQELQDLRPQMDTLPPTIQITIRKLKELINDQDDLGNKMSMKKNNRKRGRRGGVRAKLRRRGIKTPLPAGMFGNVQSVRNKMDELAANFKYLRDFRESGFLSLTETWLQEKDLDVTVNIDGFSLLMPPQLRLHLANISATATLQEFITNADILHDAYMLTISTATTSTIHPPLHHLPHLSDPNQVLTNPPQPPHTTIHPPTQANHTLSDFNPEGTILHTGRRVRRTQFFQSPT